MRYALLICTNEKEYENMTPEEGAALMADYTRWTEERNERGILQAGERLRPTSDATTVRVRNGEVLVSDGPFAETKEVMVGYDLLECANVDEAIEVASKHPLAKRGAMELRPFSPFE